MFDANSPELEKSRVSLESMLTTIRVLHAKAIDLPVRDPHSRTELCNALAIVEACILRLIAEMNSDDLT